MREIIKPEHCGCGTKSGGVRHSNPNTRSWWPKKICKALCPEGDGWSLESWADHPYVLKTPEGDVYVCEPYDERVGIQADWTVYNKAAGDKFDVLIPDDWRDHHYGGTIAVIFVPK